MNSAKIKLIMKNNGLPLTGIALYSHIENYLLECRAGSRIPENSLSVLITAVSYKISGEYKGNVARFAAVPDYHRVLGDLLEAACGDLRKAFPGHEFQWFTDNSPIPEVHTASLAGLGIIGKNGLLITKDYGSFVVLGEIVTTVPAEPDAPSRGECLSCGGCCKACPRPDSLRDKSLCVSAITQKKGKLTDSEREYIKAAGTAWGCDLCQSCCPHNINIKSSWNSEFIRGFIPEVTKNTPLQGRAYEWRGRDVLLRNLDIFEE